MERNEIEEMVYEAIARSNSGNKTIIQAFKLLIAYTIQLENEIKELKGQPKRFTKMKDK